MTADCSYVSTIDRDRGHCSQRRCLLTSLQYSYIEWLRSDDYYCAYRSTVTWRQFPSVYHVIRHTWAGVSVTVKVSIIIISIRCIKPPPQSKTSRDGAVLRFAYGNYANYLFVCLSPMRTCRAMVCMAKQRNSVGCHERPQRCWSQMFSPWITSPHSNLC